MVLALLLMGCHAPDYRAVRDWSGTATLAADYPAAAVGGPVFAATALAMPPVTSPVTSPGAEPVAASPAVQADAILAMQEVLVTYLAALACLAEDGVLPYMEDPFVGQAARVEAVDAEAGKAIAHLGALMRYATRGNARAPQLRDTIVAADPDLQTLIAGLDRAAAVPAEAPAPAPAGIAEPARRADPRLQRALLALAALHARESAMRDEARANYSEVLKRIAAGHALLKARAPKLSQAETARELRAAERQLQRISALLPRAAPPARSIAPVGQSPGSQ